MPPKTSHQLKKHHKVVFCIQLIFNRQNFVSLNTGWSCNINFFAFRFSNQCFAKWAFVTDFPSSWIAFNTSHDFESHLFIKIYVIKFYIGSNSNFRCIGCTLRNYLGITQSFFDLSNLLFQNCFFFSSCIIFAIFTYISKRPCKLNFLGNFNSANTLKICKFVF